MRLFLHAGTHKTGTSTIQRVMLEHRDAVARAGLLYPDPRAAFGTSNDGHHDLVHAIAEQQRTDVVRGFLADIRAEAGARNCDGVVLSAEPTYRHVHAANSNDWWRARQRFLFELAGALDQFDVDVVLVFRRRDTFLESLYHERVSKGSGESFSQFGRRSDTMLDYARQVEVFRSVFGSVRLLRYEDLAGPDLVTRFLRRLDQAGALQFPSAWARRSPDARLTLWMAERFAKDPDPELAAKRRRFSKTPLAADLFDDFGRVTLWSDPADRRALLDRYGDHAPIQESRGPAKLTPPVAALLDAAFDRYLGAGHPPNDGPATGEDV